MEEKRKGRPSKILLREDIERAVKMTKSNKAAARYLHCSFPHYKKYALLYTRADGVTLFEAHKNQAGVGIPKFLTGRATQAPLEQILNGTFPVEHFKPAKIKAALISEGFLAEQCKRCDFGESRLLDGKIPLILTFKDKNKHNYHRDNIELLCYNCSFLYAASPISDDQVEQMEDYIEIQVKNFDWEIDQSHIDHLKELGLWEDNKRPGDEFISRA